jgi:hypothetical protein
LFSYFFLLSNGADFNSYLDNINEQKDKDKKDSRLVNIINETKKISIAPFFPNLVFFLMIKNPCFKHANY